MIHYNSTKASLMSSASLLSSRVAIRVDQFTGLHPLPFSHSYSTSLAASVVWWWVFDSDLHPQTWGPALVIYNLFPFTFCSDLNCLYCLFQLRSVAHPAWICQLVCVGVYVCVWTSDQLHPSQWISKALYHFIYDLLSQILLCIAPTLYCSCYIVTCSCMNIGKIDRRK